MTAKAKKSLKNVASWPVAYRWAAMGTLIMYTAVGTSTVTLARAQDSPAVAAAPQGSRPVRRFDIPAGYLDAVVTAFQNTSGMRVLMPIEGMRSLPSPGVSGTYTPEQALQALLEGTGVTFRVTGADAVTLTLREVQAAVEVTAEMPAVSSPKFTEPLRDTPQSITIVPREVLEAQGATTLRDALRNVAGISLAAGEGGAQGDNLTIRGFTARNDIFNDGMRDFGSYYRDPFNMENVAVLKGPSSAIFGRGSTGGVVNQESKNPRLDPAISAGVMFGTDATRRVTLDLDKPVPMLGHGAAVRLNLMGNDSGIAGRDIAENRRFGIAPSLALGLGTPTRFTVSYFHQTANDIPDYGIPWMLNGPAPVARNNYYGFQDGNFLRTYDDIGTIKLEHDVNSNITIRNQGRYANYIRDAQITESRVPATVNATTPLDSITVARNQIAVNSVETFLDDQLDVTYRFNTGSVHHSLVTGVEGSRESSEPTRFAFTGVTGTSLLNPNPRQPFTGLPTISSTVRTTAVTAGVYVLDTIRLGQKWDLTAGIRWERFAADYAQSIKPAAAFSRVDYMPGVRAALVYKPASSGSVYFSYGTSFNPSAETLALSAANANLPPEKNRTYELGSKWDLSGNRLSLRAAMFRTEKTNARETDPTNALLTVLAGQQRVDGLEMEARGRLTSRWQLLGSYAYLDGRVTSSRFFPAAVGAQLANVPRNTFTLWNDYQLPWHIHVGAGAQFVDSRTASSTVPNDPITGLVKKVPGYWVFNAMAGYPFNDHLDLQINVYNLADKYYYDQIHPAHIVPGPGRTAMVGAKFKF